MAYPLLLQRHIMQPVWSVPSRHPAEIHFCNIVGIGNPSCNGSVGILREGQRTVILCKCTDGRQFGSVIGDGCGGCSNRNRSADKRQRQTSMSSRAQAAIGFREGNSIDIVRRSLPDDNIKREERNSSAYPKKETPSCACVPVKIQL